MRFVNFFVNTGFSRPKNFTGQKQINHDFFIFQQKSINASLSIKLVLNVKDELKVENFNGCREKNTPGMCHV